MAKLNDDGSLDFSEDDWLAPTPKKKAGDLGNDAYDQGTGGPLPRATGADGINITPTAPSSAAGTPGSYQGGSPNDPVVSGYAGGADNSILGLLQSGMDPQKAIALFNQKNGRGTGNEATYYNDTRGQTIGLPGGYAALTPNGWTWTDRTPETGGNAGGSNTPASGTSDLSSLLMSLLTANKGNNTDPARSALLGRLNGLLDQYSQPVSKDDPNIAGPTQAYTGQVGRSVNDFKKQAAERAYAEGVPTGAFDSQIGNATLAGGRSVGDFETNLMSQELQSRRANLISTLNSAGGLLSAQDQADIQNKIANIDAVIKSKGLDLTKDLGQQGLDLQKLLGTGQLANQSTAINNQNSQFYDEFGLDSANQGSTLDDILASYLVGRS